MQVFPKDGLVYLSWLYYEQYNTVSSWILLLFRVFIFNLDPPQDQIKAKLPCYLNHISQIFFKLVRIS